MDFMDLINIEMFNELAAKAPDNEWREIRIYVRRGNDGKAEIRFDPEARMVVQTQ